MKVEASQEVSIEVCHLGAHPSHVAGREVSNRSVSVLPEWHVHRTESVRRDGEQSIDSVGVLSAM